ncbi:MAG: hypothetical protein F6K50_48970 [Moorea sp. SIO3I7]|uniref:hypothetical protein n=1 Tax=unclassified Moorena TaxID=2683338 RepID=UPI00117F688D|nr:MULTISPECIES: hypothetical protein [unclassified Moorena]NEO02980.1 hypothetical protein [Moorena sp. SIO3I7]NEO12973.1 hypothetical protein [Moorena sp. SIO3E8]NEO61789.1 hypothetical protein [Moorena sp. SIO4G2]NEP99857.1 hypothetical protein [Moorena sp. SIO3F7]
MSDCIKTEKLCSSSNKIFRIPPLTTIPCSRLDVVAHGGNHGSRSWGEPRQLLMGETPKTALPPQDRAASPRPRCIAVPRSLLQTVYLA